MNHCVGIMLSPLWCFCESKIQSALKKTTVVEREKKSPLLSTFSTRDWSQRHHQTQPVDTRLIPTQLQSAAWYWKRGHCETAKPTTPQVYLKEKVYCEYERKNNQRYLRESKAAMATFQGGREEGQIGDNQGYLSGSRERSGKKRASWGRESLPL